MALPTQTALVRLLIVAAALGGLLVVTHLQLQANNGFANGCSGLASAPVTYDPSAPAEVVGCAEVTQGAYGTQFGVSNIVWGFVFYGFLALVRLAYAATGDDRLRRAAFGVSGIGVLYAAYLVYIQAAVIHQFCVLCLISSTFVLTLFVLHLLESRRLAAPAGAEAKPSRRAPRAASPTLRPYAPLLGAFLLLVGADIVLASNSDAAPATPDTEASASPLAPGTVAAAGQPGDPAQPLAVTAGGATCGFDPDIAPIADLTPFTSGPYVGSPDETAVKVVEIFDPNCPHCRDLGEVLEPIEAAEAGRARFYSVAYPLRQQSVAQVIALKIAQREGKFFELMHEMFDRQDQMWGMTVPELVSTLDAVGMNGAAFQATLENEATLQPLLTQVQADAAAVGTAFASRDGGISTPRVAIGGRVVLPTAYTAECFAQLIGEAAAAR